MISLGKDYGSFIKITDTLLGKSNYDLEFEIMKEEWEKASIVKKVFIIGMYKLPKKFKGWLY